MARERERDVYIRGGKWWGVVPREGGEAERRSLRLPASVPRTEAIARWLDLSKVQRAADAAENTPRVGKAFDDYIAEQRRRGRSDATIEIDETKAGHFVRLWGRGMPLHHVTARLVAQYVETRESENAHPRTIQRELIALRGALKLALHRGVFAMPLERVMPLGYAAKYIPKTRWLPHDEALRIFHELPEDRRGWFAFALATGARKGEIERAELADIGEHEVHIRGTKTRAAADTVPITSIQRPWLALARRHGAKVGPAFGVWTNVLRGLRHATDRLSTCEGCRKKGRGTPNPDCLVCRRTPKVARVSPNDLRRTLGYWLRDAGVEPHLIGKVLRHVDSRMAEMVYAKGSKAGIRGLLEAQIAAGRVTVAPRKVVRHSVRNDGDKGASERRMRRGSR